MMFTVLGAKAQDVPPHAVKKPAVQAPAATVTTPVQPTPATQAPPMSLGGFTLGEDVAVHFQDAVTFCANPPHQITPEEVRAMKHVSNKKAEVKAAEQGRVWSGNIDKFNEICKGIHDGRWEPSSYNLQMTISHGFKPDEAHAHDPSTLYYQNGKLVKVGKGFGRFEQEVVLADALTRWGKPTTEYTEAMQNGFGARWSDHMYSWDLPGGHVELYVSYNPVTAKTTIDLQTTEEYAKQSREREAKNKNSLD